MDLILLIGIATALLAIILSLLYFKNKSDKTTEQSTAVLNRRPVPVRIQHDVPVRAQIARNQRNRARTAAATASTTNDPPRQVAPSTTIAENDYIAADSDNDDEQHSKLDGTSGSKIGAKKRAKIEAKAEKKVRQEHEQQLREEKRKRDELAEQDRAKHDEIEQEEERKREEAERLARELKEKQEYEEYIKLKAAFSVEEEGFDEIEAASENDNALQVFIEYIQMKKVVILEELAKEFKLKTQAVIDRIHELKASGQLTGVIDDRGKFIFISEEELRAVAKFVRQRGRISISELVESSNDLINLTPVEVK